MDRSLRHEALAARAVLSDEEWARRYADDVLDELHDLWSGYLKGRAYVERSLAALGVLMAAVTSVKGAVGHFVTATGWSGARLAGSSRWEAATRLADEVQTAVLACGHAIRLVELRHPIPGEAAAANAAAMEHLKSRFKEGAAVAELHERIAELERVLKEARAVDDLDRSRDVN